MPKNNQSIKSEDGLGRIKYDTLLMPTQPFVVFYDGIGRLAFATLEEAKTWLKNVKNCEINNEDWK